MLVVRQLRSQEVGPTSLVLLRHILEAAQTDFECSWCQVPARVFCSGQSDGDPRLTLAAREPMIDLQETLAALLGDVITCADILLMLEEVPDEGVSAAALARYIRAHSLAPSEASSEFELVEGLPDRR